MPRLGALSRAGLVAALTVEGVTDGAVLRAFVRERRLPPRHPGQILLMAHRQAHQVAGVAAACAAAGVRLLDLPPSAPDFSPLEACWSKVKALPRAQAARTLEALEQAIAEALAALTSQEAHGWFGHAGSCVASN